MVIAPACILFSICAESQHLLRNRAPARARDRMRRSARARAGTRMAIDGSGKVYIPNDANHQSLAALQRFRALRDGRDLFAETEG